MPSKETTIPKIHDAKLLNKPRKKDMIVPIVYISQQYLFLTPEQFVEKHSVKLSYGEILIYPNTVNLTI